MTEGSFCFNFIASDDITANNTKSTNAISNSFDKNAINISNDAVNNKTSKKSPTISPKSQFIQLSSSPSPSYSNDNINSNTTTLPSSSYECITVHSNIPPIKKVSSSKTLLSNTATATTINNDTDIIPGVYEGGLKVWECSLDICYLLAEQLILSKHDDKMNNITINDANSIPLLQNLISSSKQDDTFVVLELGCGHALPSCFLLQHELCTNFLLLDYNEFVLKDVTLSNINLNLPMSTRGTTKEKNVNVGWISGDWIDISNNWNDIIQSNDNKNMIVKNKRVDCIIASETIYTKQHTLEMIQFLLHHLKIGTGIGIIATKRYYFGCGGGTNELFTAASDTTLFLEEESDKYCKLDLEVVKVIDNGMSNIREIILARCVVIT